MIQIKFGRSSAVKSELEVNDIASTKQDTSTTRAVALWHTDFSDNSIQSPRKVALEKERQFDIHVTQFYERILRRQDPYSTDSDSME
jgi:uncharacterized protein YvpB